MAFSSQFLDELVARCDIVDVVSDYVQLTKKGSNLFGLCPFHSEKTGSFSVSPDKQIYHCFGCGKGGGVINFIMEEENLSFPDAVRFLAKRANMEVPEDDYEGESHRLRKRVLDLNRDAARWYYTQLQEPQGAAVAAYLDKRKITRKTAVSFGLGASLDEWDALIRAMTEKGYTKAELLAAGLAVKNKNGGLYDKFRNRLILPVIDVRGDVIGFGSRVLDHSEPKYMNSPETVAYSKRRALYAINLAKRTKRPNMILCEGNIDVITLHQAGFDNAVASMGTALTVEQTRLLSRYTKELVICYDNDGAGKAATQRALELLNNSEFTVRVLQLPNRIEDGKPVKQDVDDYIKLYGPAAFERVLSGSGTGIEYSMSVIAAKYDLTTDDGRIGYSAEISDAIAALPSPVEREVYALRAAEACGITAEAMKAEVARALRRRMSQAKKKQERKDLNPAAEHQPKERSIRYDDLRSAMAEEGVVRLIALAPELFGDSPPLEPGDFSSPLLGKVFFLLWKNRAEGRGTNVPLLAGELTGEEMSHITGVMQKPESLSNGAQALGDYIRTILEQRDKRNAGGGEDGFLAALGKLKEKKNYGGKLNGQD
jgi:DNA primase